MMSFLILSSSLKWKISDYEKDQIMSTFKEQQEEYV